MDREFDKYLEEISSPMVDAPAYAPPESIPMERTVLVDIAEAEENRKSYIEEDSSAREARKAQGTLAPPVDVYEPGFRTDLTAAIRRYFSEQAKIRKNNDRIRRITGIGRTV